jgi:lysyl-tRNA synthetase class 2
MSDSLKQDRLAKLDQLRQLQVDPYGQRVQGIQSTSDVHAEVKKRQLAPGESAEDASVRVAGRIMALKRMGKLVFITLRDRRGDLQVGLSKKQMAEQWPVVQLLDYGDTVFVDGALGVTRTGENTVWATDVGYLSKSLLAPPEKWHGLKDVDQRYRRRYVDLFANPDVRTAFEDRSTIIQAIRQCLLDRNYLEVETPVLQPLYGGAAARPFVTHHNTLDMDLYLRISPELYLKRLLVGGLERVFEFAKNFRNEGISTRHNPEFTMLELYQAYGDYHDMMDITEAMVVAAVEKLGGGFKRQFGDHEIDYTPPWPRRPYADLLEEHAGLPMSDIDGLRKKAQSFGLAHEKLADAVLVNKVFEETVEDRLINPTFVIDYPAELCPLTRRKSDDPSLALRFEVFVAGMELGNAYSELNDPQVQHQTFSQHLAGEGDETMAVMDEDYIMALEYGMPSAGGLGVGIDRLVMLLTGQTSIRDVILFPLQRPLPSNTG